jgi:hypothetical protein
VAEQILKETIKNCRVCAVGEGTEPEGAVCCVKHKRIIPPEE